MSDETGAPAVDEEAIRAKHSRQVGELKARLNDIEGDSKALGFVAGVLLDRIEAIGLNVEIEAERARVGRRDLHRRIDDHEEKCQDRETAKTEAAGAVNTRLSLIEREVNERKWLIRVAVAAVVAQAVGSIVFKFFLPDAG